jgi:hypothetical protein
MGRGTEPSTGVVVGAGRTLAVVTLAAIVLSGVLHTSPSSATVDATRFTIKETLARGVPSYIANQAIYVNTQTHLWTVPMYEGVTSFQAVVGQKYEFGYSTYYANRYNVKVQGVSGSNLKILGTFHGGPLEVWVKSAGSASHPGVVHLNIGVVHRGPTTTVPDKKSPPTTTIPATSTTTSTTF